MAQLVEWLFPVSEVCGSNQVLDKIYIENLFTDNCFEKTKIKKEWLGMVHLKKLK